MASFLLLERDGHKIITIPVRPSHLDQAIIVISNIELQLIKLLPGKSGKSLSEAFSTKCNYKLNFSSDDVKNGRKCTCVCGCACMHVCDMNA